MGLEVDLEKPYQLCNYVDDLGGVEANKKRATKAFEKLDPACILTRGDEAGQRVLVYVSFSKTNQFMKRSHVIPIPANSDPALDLFHHLKQLFSSVDLTDDTPAFSYSKNRFSSC
jgi:hypothetical protein